MATKKMITFSAWTFLLAGVVLILSFSTAESVPQDHHSFECTGGELGCLCCHLPRRERGGGGDTNLSFIRTTISTPNSGDKEVVFTSKTGTNSYGETGNGICEVCHTTTKFFQNDGVDPVTSHRDDHAGTSCVSLCHPHDDSFKGAGECTTCHDSEKTRTKGGGGTRRQIVGTGGDYEKQSHHVIQYGAQTTEIVTIWDCVVCHAEGDTSDGGTTTYHNDTNGKIDLRNVDTGAVISIENNGFTGTWDATIETELSKVDTFCFTCHDSDGATGFTVNSTNDGIDTSGTRALTPFNTNDDLNRWLHHMDQDGTTQNTTEYTDYPSRTRVVDCYSQFDTTNDAHHAVRGARGTGWLGISASAWTTPSWRTTLGMGETTQQHCFDCHVPNAHGGPMYYLQRYGPGGATTSVLGGDNTENVCHQCHNWTEYWQSNAGLSNVGSQGWSRYNHGDNMGSFTGSFGIICLLCHGGFGNSSVVDPRDSKDTIVSGANGVAFGSIHGTSSPLLSTYVVGSYGSDGDGIYSQGDSWPQGIHFMNGSSQTGLGATVSKPGTYKCDADMDGTYGNSCGAKTGMGWTPVTNTYYRNIP
ncbi:MAG: hypothetical protein ACYTBV_03625 [Planctomycetota bacterium]|jgi:hypothetical protein